MNAESVVTADQVSVRYGSFTAVDRVCFKVEAGSVYALLGRNGAGKSSLVRAMLGQMPADEGRLRVFGFDCWRDRRQVMARVGVVPERLDVPPTATATMVADYLERVNGGWDRGCFLDRLDALSVDPGRIFARLSKGQQRWFGLALALAGSPDLVILDDPTLGLDVVARDALYGELIDELSERGATVLITTHDLAGVEGIATHVGVLNGGQLVLSELLDDLKRAVRRVCLRLAPEVEADAVRCRAAELEVHDLAVTGRLLTGVTRAWDRPREEELRRLDGVEALEHEVMSLEDIFLHLCRERGGRS